MTVAQLAEKLSLKVLTLPEPDREISSCYCGDLLSWVMGRAKASDVWITIMSNINVIAVATLTDVSCVVFSDGVIPDKEIIKTAGEKGVNLLFSDDDTYKTAVKISGITNE